LNLLCILLFILLVLKCAFCNLVSPKFRLYIYLFFFNFLLSLFPTFYTTFPSLFCLFSLIMALVFQESWLYDNVISTLNSSIVYNSVVKLNFTPKDTTPILRIIKIVGKSATSDLLVIVADSTHKMFARVLYSPTIVEFENTYHQRFTYCTTNSLILVNAANLSILLPSTIVKDFDVPVDLSVNYVVMDLILVQLVQRDQIQLNSDLLLKFIYYEKQYQLHSKSRPNHNSTVVQSIEKDYDDVKSI